MIGSLLLFRSVTESNLIVPVTTNPTNTYINTAPNGSETMKLAGLKSSEADWGIILQLIGTFIVAIDIIKNIKKIISK